MLYTLCSIIAWSALIVAVIFLFFPWLVVAAGAWAYPEVVWCGPPRDGYHRHQRIAITIDDISYKPVSYFEAILDALDARGAKCTFFIIASYVRETPAARPLLVRAVRNGHQLGNHGNTDKGALRMFRSTRAGWYWEVQVCETLIREIYTEAGVAQPSLYEERSGHPIPMPLYRPGHGFLNREMLDILRAKDGIVPGVHFTTVLGNVYPLDPAIQWVWFLCAYIAWHVRPRSVIILHDRAATPAVLNQLLPWLTGKYACVTVHDLLHLP